jgi:1-deoxy-D-xylulose-5-phosphate synthase
MSRVLSKVNQPQDLKSLSIEELKQLAQEIRHRIVEVVNSNGGHLASNLGSVEITLALHRVFEFPRDRLVWDVSHQTYPHKLITGRRDRFHLLRTYRGISGFCNKKESAFDLFDAGHAGTAVSLGLGVACADQLLGRKCKTVAVVGDAAIASGMAFEALNHAGYLERNLLVVLNDNRMSIDVSVGALSRYLNKIRTKPLYQDIKKDVREILAKIPMVGKKMDVALDHIRESLKHSLLPGRLFQDLGFNYFGPVDGHDIESLMRLLEDLKDIQSPVLLHILTVKGHGYEPASQNPIKYHASKNFLGEPKKKPKASDPEALQEQRHANALEPEDSRKRPTYTDVFQEAIVAMGRKDSRVVAITAAMPSGTGLVEFAKQFPDRYFDVGIAEQHGCALASGMACGGLRPIFAVYSTFCQRCFDQVVHDVCIQENPVILCLDRAGLVGEDGWTHHGVFDISFLRSVPNTVLMAPRDAEELIRMLQWALEQPAVAVCIRYPKGTVPSLPPSKDPVLRIGKAEILREGEGVALHAYGSMVEEAWKAAALLEGEGMDVTVVNARFAKPLDGDVLRQLSRNHHTLVTVEEHALQGGFGGAVLEKLADQGISFCRVMRLGVPDSFQTFGNRERLLADCGLDAAGIARKIVDLTSIPRPSGTPEMVSVPRMQKA